MEFATDLQSNLRSRPRGTTFTTTAPDGKPGISWKSQYGYLYLDSMNVDRTVDGMNEYGLSFGALYLPGETQYQTVPAEKSNQALPYMSVGDWILGNFKTTDEVRKAITSVYVFSQKIDGLGDIIFPLHFAIHDASGKSIIVEYVGGKMQIYDNAVGILTNSPIYSWHIANLRNYLNLSPYAPDPIVAGGMTFTATGQGAGDLGMPGDSSPPSRFVKIAYFKKYVLQTNDALSTINLAEHLMNTVDIPLGSVRAKQANAEDSDELTQWVVFKDLTHKIFYYRTYRNLTLRSVDMSKVDFSEKAVSLKMPIASDPYVMDVTQQFLTQAVQ